MNLHDMTDRIQEIRNVVEPAKYIKQRLAAAASELNRSADLATYTEVANEALVRLALILYDAGADGQPANYDPYTNRILIPVPWGSDGWKKWGMRQWEAVIMRKVMKARTDTAPRTGIRSLVGFFSDTQSWYLNTSAYPTKETALEYLKAYPITPNEWATQRDFYKRKRDRNRKRKVGK